ncbi:MAG: G-D-S-L family lipolytic protein [Chitinophagaceae bacterium]|nr:MAG: G-D-S-L family lipolytic protein [Chitinophagaceae bacterium]
MKKTIGLIGIMVLLLGTSLLAQTPAFYEDIQKFKSMDSTGMPPKNAIVFTGSSSFTRWTDVQSRFPGYTIINRGFGGSSLPDVIRYADDVIIKYKPKQVVIYCGENDAAGDSSVTADTITNRFKTLFGIIRSRLPRASITFVSMKPSPSRAKVKPVIIRANDMIREFLSKNRNTAYIDIYSKMLDSARQPVPELFVSDSLHMSEKGYDIWQVAIRPYLKK